MDKKPAKIRKKYDLYNIREEVKRKKALKPGGTRYRITVHLGTCGIASGAETIRDLVKEEIYSENRNDIEFTTSGCVGFCALEPMLTIESYNMPPVIYYGLDKDKVKKIFESHINNGKIANELEPITQDSELSNFYKYQESRVLRNRGKIDPFNIEDYIANNGYLALARVIEIGNPEKIIKIVSEAGLRGRGGAGFPTGKKWELCKNAKSTNGIKYVICNGDEGDPGAFMDRNLLESDPHSIIEGMLIAASSIGSNKGHIYIRAEYPLAVKTMEHAIRQAKDYGLIGKNILNSGFDFDVEIYQGAGAFVCGEETALIRSIEGKRGMPRPKPPFPANEGLYGKPTLINNVETLSNIPQIILNGPEWFSSIGTELSKGTKIFALTGAVKNIGLVEIPMGMTIRDIVFKIGGGIKKGKKFKAIQLGGPSGGCIPEKFLDIPIDYEKVKEVGAIMGSGGMIVLDEDTCMVDLSKYFMGFIQEESCGQCVPCRIGTRRILEILERITRGEGKKDDIEKLEKLSAIIKETSLCGLGKTAPNPIISTICHFRYEYEAHIKYKRCPAVVCKEIISSPCQHICPIGTETSVYISLIAKKHFKEAFDIILKDNPLPSVCARVCHHPCESNCLAGKWGDPIAIRTLKKFVTEYALKTGIYTKPPREQKTGGQKIAIIGSGPAGLMASFKLVNKGYNVTIFEELDFPGGALAACIPEYRLPRDMLNLDIENIRNAGVEIKTNTKVGKDLPFNELLKHYKAVFIATGAHKSRKLYIPNEDAESIIYAMEFLRDIKSNKKINIGKNVGIIGGGNAAIDAARTALRIKDCNKVLVIYRRTSKEMPAFREEITAAIEEGIEIQFLTAPTGIITKNGKISGIECRRMKLGEVDENGRRKPIPIENSEFIINLDTLIVAIGEEPDLGFFDKESNIEISKRGTIMVCPETLVTNIDGVFAGGDVVTGPGTVIDAMSAGKIAAEMIDKYIRGKNLVREYKLTRPSMYVTPVTDLVEKDLEEAIRPETPCLAVNERINNFNEVVLNISEKEAVREAKRCLRCDLETEEGEKVISEK